MATFYSVIQVSEYIKCVSFTCDSNLFNQKLDFTQIPQTPAGSGQCIYNAVYKWWILWLFLYSRTLEKVLIHFNVHNCLISVFRLIFIFYVLSHMKGVTVENRRTIVKCKSLQTVCLLPPTPTPQPRPTLTFGTVLGCFSLQTWNDILHFNLRPAIKLRNLKE